MIRNNMLARWRAEPNVYMSVETAARWFERKHRLLVHCAHRYLTTHGHVNFGVGFSARYAAAGAAKVGGQTQG